MNLRVLLFLFGMFISLLNVKGQDWVEKSKSLPSFQEKLDRFEFGYSVDVSGEYAVVGAIGPDKIGRAYVLQNSGTAWEIIATLTPSDAGKFGNMNFSYAQMYFGCDVSIYGDIIVIGASDAINSHNCSGAVYVFKKPVTGWVDMTETARLTASDVEPDDEFGRSVSISGDNIVVGAYGDERRLGSAYVFEKPATGWVNMTETAKLKASDGAQNDRFGYSVSISGDNIVVGATGDDDKNSNSGSAYVFEKPATGWVNMTETAKLTALDGYRDDSFGISVSISGDNIAVGAYQDDDNGYNSGSAYVFEKPATGWVNMTETAKLTTSDGAEYDNFGISLSLNGDNVVVGAYGNDDSGSAYVFEKPATGWVNMTETAKLTASDGASKDSFGKSVSISGDNIVVGANGDDENGSNSGSGYLFRKQDTGWTSMTQSFKAIPLPGILNFLNKYGCSVAISGDYAVVGSSGYCTKIGCVYLLYNNSVDWERVAVLTSSDGESNDNFGISVSISGDNIVVGADGNDDSGSVYVFEKPATGWINMTETAKLTSSDGAQADYFGISVSISGDNIVVGAYGDDENGSYSGSAYVFEKPATGWVNMTETAKLIASDGSIYDNFGESVSISGDNIVVGADRYDNYKGSAYVFEKPATGWVNMTETAKLTASDAEAHDEFGVSVSISGDNIVVGAKGDDDKNTNSGSAYIFEKPATGWINMTETAKLTASDAEAYDVFGVSVSISGDNIVVGAQGDDDKNTNSGSAYVFEKPATGWINMTETAKLTSSDGGRSDCFGKSVSISGDNIVVGVTYDDDKGYNSGSAFIFKRNNIPQIANVTFNVDENSIEGTFVGKVIAVDNDGDELSFNIISGDDYNAFAIDTEGNITVKTSAELDYETTTSYNLTIQVSDGISLGEGNITVKVNDVTETGMHEVVASDVNVYPNPVKDCLHIKSEEVIAQIKIYNIAGSVVYLNNPSTSYEIIDFTELGSGIYMVYIKTESNTTVNRVIVE